MTFDSALLPFSQDTFEPARLLNDLRLESASTEDFGDLYQDGLLHFQAQLKQISTDQKS